MKRDEFINKLVDAAIASTDNMERAKPTPFLLTRINARLAAYQETGWAKAAAFICRPAVLAIGFCMIVLVNGWVIFDHSKTIPATFTEQASSITADEFSASVVSIYESDNP